MPLSRTYRKKPTNRRKKMSSFNKKKKSYKSKLENTRIDTIVEYRMKEIAKNEVNKQLVKNLVRTFNFGSYVEATNTYTPLIINHTGAIQECMLINKADFDPGVGQPITVGPGTRIGNTIKITGFQLSVRALLAENNSLATLDKCVVTLSIVQLLDDWDQGAGPPNIGETLPWYPFGYSKRIDSDISPESNNRNIKVLLEKSIKFRSTEMRAQTKTKKYFVNLNNPITVQYNTDDVAGDCNPTNYKFYLTARSNIPDLTADQNMFPKICTCLKTYYVEL